MRDMVHFTKPYPNSVLCSLFFCSPKTPFGDAEILSKKKTTAAEMPEALSELASFREELIGRGEIKYEREESAN